MDPVTAFAAAQAAVAGIQKAIKLGKDINGLIGEFGKFFDAKDVVQKAANDNAKKGQSDTARAMEVVMQANALREAHLARVKAKQKAADIAMGVTAAVAFVGALLGIVWMVFAILDTGR
jgi:pyruvoyl-dependent arginine decarboxylase (PvlArgDC)